MIKYYSIETSLNEKIMGKIPQIKEYVHNCDVENESRFIDKFIFKKIEIQPILSNVVLYANAKQTDFIDSYGSVGFDFSYLISDKFRNILDQFNTFGFQYFKTFVIQNRKNFENYWQIKKYDFPLHFIDFKKSTLIFKDRDINRNVISETINFDGLKEFNLFANNLHYPKMISFKDIYFTENMDLDFFALRYTEGGQRGIVSENLKNELEKNNITGIEFRPIELSLNEWLNGGEREKIYGKSW